MDMATSMSSMAHATQTASMMSMMSMMSTMSSQMASMSMAMATSSSQMAMGSGSSSMAMPMATSTSSSGHGGHGMGGMDMGGGSCKVQMIWNWETIDSCFLSSGWHVRTSGQFAGTCIGVFLWVMFLVLFSRVRKEFDSYIVRNKLRRFSRATQGSGAIPVSGTADACVPIGATCPAQNPGVVETTEKLSDQSVDHPKAGVNFSGRNYYVGDIDSNRSSPNMLQNQKSHAIRPSIYEQVVRALLYGFEYSVIWLLGLILMSYNGYVIISAFLGATIGFLLLNWEALYTGQMETPSAPTCC